jgi:hypothetical protein
MIGAWTVFGVGLLVVAGILWWRSREREFIRLSDPQYPKSSVVKLMTKRESVAAIRRALAYDQANLKKIEARIENYREQLRR